MSKEFVEPEELNGKEEKFSANNPFDKPVNEKPYTRPNVTATAEQLATEIPVPAFQAPPIDLGKPPVGGGAATGPGSSAPPPPKKDPPRPVNPEMEGMTTRDSKKAASYVANMIMQGYEWLNDFASKGMQFKKSKLNKLAQSGEVDFSIQIPYDYASQSTMSIGEFIQEYNSQNQNAFQVTQKFKDEATPILEKVLQKRGVGMTDEQYLAYLFGKDISLKAVMFMTARSQMNEMLKSFKEMTEMQNGTGEYGPEPNMSHSAGPSDPDPVPAGSGPAYTASPAFDEAIVVNDVEKFDESQFNTEEQVPTGPGTVQEEVDAQLQNISVTELRRRAIQNSRNELQQKRRKPRQRQ